MSEEQGPGAVAKIITMVLIIAVIAMIIIGLGVAGYAGLREFISNLIAGP